MYSNFVGGVTVIDSRTAAGNELELELLERAELLELGAALLELGAALELELGAALELELGAALELELGAALLELEAGAELLELGAALELEAGAELLELGAALLELEELLPPCEELLFSSTEDELENELKSELCALVELEAD